MMENNSRWESYKADLITVLKPEDRGTFSDIVETFFARIPNYNQELKESILTNIAYNLQEMEENDHLIINSHGSPTTALFYGEPSAGLLPQASVNQVVQTLINDFDLPETAKIKVSACYSAQGKGEQIVVNHLITKSRKVYKFIVENKGPFSLSLAGKLEERLIELQPKREKGNVYGYLGETITFSKHHKNMIISENGKLVKKNIKGKLSEFKKDIPIPYEGEKIKNIKIKRSLTRTNAFGTYSGQH